MKKYWKVLAGCFALVVLIGGSTLLYRQLSSQYRAENLEIAEEPNVDNENTLAETEEGTGAKEAEKENSEENTSAAPDFTVENAEGEKVTLSSFEGKPVILNFWASWCSPCKTEMPDFQAAYDTYGEDIQFMMVNMTDGARETRQSGEDFIKEQGFTFPVFYDVDLEAAYAYYVTSIPTTYFIDAEGNIEAAGRGMLDSEALEKGISILMEQ